MKANEEEPDWSAVLVGADSDISDASGLAGQTIAVNTLANIGEVTIRASLDGQDVDTSGLQFIELGFPDMPAALAEGQVEAIWVVEPFVTIASAEGAQVVDYNYLGTEPGMEIAAYFTTTEYAEANPDVIEAFVGAITAAEEMITADEQVAARRRHHLHQPHTRARRRDPVRSLHRHPRHRFDHQHRRPHGPVRSDRGSPRPIWPTGRLSPGRRKTEDGRRRLFRGGRPSRAFCRAAGRGLPNSQRCPTRGLRTSGNGPAPHPAASGVGSSRSGGENRCGGPRSCLSTKY